MSLLTLDYLNFNQKLRVIIIRIFYIFILLLFIWSIRGLIIYPFINVFISVYNFFAIEQIPKKNVPDTNLNLPPRPA